jgi:small conductance mechanosensitive channel
MIRRLCRWCICALVLAAVAASAGVAPAGAQSPTPGLAPAASDTVAIEILEKLIGTLENDAERAKFIEQLRAVIAAENKVTPPAPVMPDRVGTRFLDTLSEGLGDVGEAISSAAAFLADAPELFGWFAEQFGNERNRDRLAEIFGKVLLVLAAGWLAEWLVGASLRKPRMAIERRPIETRWRRAGVLILYQGTTLLSLLAFAIVAFGALAVVTPSRITRLVALALINANVIARVIMLAVGLALAPRVPALRLAPLGDETATYLDLWLRRLVSLAVYGYFAAEAALLIGMPRAGHGFILEALGVLIALLLIILILRNRDDVARVLGGRTGAEDHSLRARLARYWHVAAMLYVAFVTLVWLVQPGSGFEFVARATALTAIIIVAAAGAIALARRLLARLFKISDESRDRYPMLEAHANRYVQIMTGVITIAAWGSALLAILQAWGLGSLDWLETPFGQRVGASALAIAIAIALATVVWELANLWFERYIERCAVRGAEDLRRAQRMRTLLPMIRRILMVILVAFVGLIALSELGVNITPLLALSGAVGLAVGLGAQNTIKDFITGMSIILEDSIAIGDTVHLGDKAGVVEWMSIRAIRLRDADGAVHTIPFSQFQIISNLTKDFAFAVFDVGVGYGENVDKVMEVLRKEGAVLRDEPEMKWRILSDLEVLGVDRLADSAVIIKARFKTHPTEQWNVIRAFNRQIKFAFDREGIEIPFPQRTIHIASPGPLAPSAPSAT